MAKQCNPKCMICSNGPALNEEILSFDWLRTESNAKGTLEFKPYGSDTPRPDYTGDLGDIFSGIFDKKKKQTASSPRFGWVHKRCIEGIGDLRRSMKEMVQNEVAMALKNEK